MNSRMTKINQSFLPCSDDSFPPGSEADDQYGEYKGKISLAFSQL